MFEYGRVTKFIKYIFFKLYQPNYDKKIVSAWALSFYPFVNIHWYRSKNDNLLDRQRH